MTAHLRPPPQAARLADLAPDSAAAVLFFRLVCAGEGPALCAETAAYLGRDGAAGLVAALDRLAALLAAGARPKLLRHAPGCPCLGADEAWVADLIATAARGEREGALGLAFGRVRPDLAQRAVAEAEQAGLSLRRLALCARRRTLH